MTLMLEDLDGATRPHMLAELDRDEGPPDRVYVSSRLSGRGQAEYRGLLREALARGTTGSFELALSTPGVLNDRERRVREGTPYLAAMPSNAAQVMAEGQFNRYYIRGLCLRVLDEGGGEVQVYRARPSLKPRPESQRMIGRLLDPALLLDDLRLHLRDEPTLLPFVNSGLTVRVA